MRWNYRLRLPAGGNSDAAVQAVTAQTRAELPETGWEIRSRSNASPQLERNVNRFTQFLTIVGLTALLVGGVGVGNAVKSHLDRRREVIATMKALGASGRRVFAIYLTQVLVLALIGGVIGAILGAALPFLISWTFGAIIPLPLNAGVPSGGTGAGVAVWPADGAGLHAVAARPRPRRAGRRAVSRWGHAAVRLAAADLYRADRHCRRHTGRGGGAAGL